MNLGVRTPFGRSHENHLVVAMKIICFYFGLALRSVFGTRYDNSSLDAAGRQLLDFKLQHPVPELLTTSEGEPVELRETIAINSDFFDNQHYLDEVTHVDRERIPERLVHAKGVGTYGYFEVTNDVSKYTKAEVFNGIGKKTPLAARFSSSRQRLGGTDLGRDFKGLAVKFYSKEGNLDFTCLNTPVFILKDPVDFPQSVRSFRWNPVTDIVDPTMQWDFNILRPTRILPVLWLMSDYGIPKGYRRMDMFPIHTYELSNEHGETHYVRFNFRTEQSLDNFTSAEALAVSAEDPDYFSRDMYNAIAAKKYPSWRLEMDVLSLSDLKKVDYNPFDLTTMWKNETYRVVTIGRMVINKFGSNHFKDSEQSAYCPGNLVPGIPGPVDVIFRSRKLFYRDTQNYRLGVNHQNIEVNMPKNKQTYNRDGAPPVRENMEDVPNYRPNSFNGPIPYVDENRPKKLRVLENTVVDFEQISNFYNNILGDDAHRQRTADNVAASLENIDPKTAVKVIELLMLAEPDLAKRVARTLKALKAASQKQSLKERYQERAECLERNMQNMYH